LRSISTTLGPDSDVGKQNGVLSAKMWSFRKLSRSASGVSGVMTAYGFVLGDRLNLVMQDKILSVCAVTQMTKLERSTSWCIIWYPRDSPRQLPTSPSRSRLRCSLRVYDPYQGPCWMQLIQLIDRTWVANAVRRRGRYVRYVRKVAIVCEFYRVRDKLTSRQTECRRQLQVLHRSQKPKREREREIKVSEMVTAEDQESHLYYCAAVLVRLRRQHGCIVSVRWGREFCCGHGGGGCWAAIAGNSRPRRR